MRTIALFIARATALASLATLLWPVIPLNAQENTAALRLVARMSMPDVAGDFDHFDVDLKGQRLFLTGEDQGTIEVFDLQTGKRTQSIPGFKKPHSILFIPESKKLFVTDGGDGTPKGSLKTLDADTFKILESVDLLLDADSAGFDPENHRYYVDNGGKDPTQHYELISIFDTTTGKHLSDIQLPDISLEAVIPDHLNHRLFVNMKEHSQVGIVDPEKRSLLSTWALTAEQPSPMAFDETNHRLFVGCRKPPTFLVLNTDSGKVISSLPTVGRADDAFYDVTHKRIYISGGPKGQEGFISIYDQIDPDHYKARSKVVTGESAKTALFVPELNRLYVAVPRHGTNSAEVQVYEPTP
jgi:DNA-binding beta-propeller fold protein YncE